MIRLIAPLALLAVAGCASTPVVAPPRIVTVTKIQYVPLPAADLLPCTMAVASIDTGADVVAAWQRAEQALAVCNAQIEDLSKLNAKGTP